MCPLCMHAVPLTCYTHQLYNRCATNACALCCDAHKPVVTVSMSTFLYTIIIAGIFLRGLIVAEAVVVVLQ